MKQRRLKAVQAQELGLTLYARWTFDDLPRRALEELGDALLVWACGETLDEITRRAISLVWTRGLERDVRDCVVELENDPRYADITARALYELDTDHGDSKLAREFIRQVALQYAHHDLPFFCLCCIDEGVKNREGPARRLAALEAVAVAAADAKVDESEVRDALRRAGMRPGSLPLLLATDERRAAVRSRLERLARLGVSSVPDLSRELRKILSEPMPRDPGSDAVWGAACGYIAERALSPALN